MTALLRSLSLAVVFASYATACILPDLSLEGLACPCAAGYTCDASTNTCVSGDGGSTPTQPTTTSTGPGAGGSDGDGGGSVVAGGAPPSTGGASGTGGTAGDGGFGTGGDGSGGAPPVGGTCDAPIDLADPGSVLATTVGAGDDIQGNCVDGTGPDVVYRVTAAQTGVLDFTLFSAAELHFYVRTDCLDGSTELLCVDKGGVNAFEVASLMVTQGDTVYVIVDGHGGEQSAFSLDVASHP